MPHGHLCLPCRARSRPSLLEPCCPPPPHPPLPPPLQVDEFLALCDWAAADVKARYPGAAPAFFIGGHSLGGLVAALGCHRDQRRWAGLLVCSPAMDVEMGLVLK